MKVELEFIDEEEFVEFIRAYNNALVDYDDIMSALSFGCGVSSKWYKISEKQMADRVILLKDKYFELLDKENELKE